MTTKEKIKQEIDQLPENQLDRLYYYLNTLKKGQKARPIIRSLKLKGKLDHKHIRSVAHE